MHIQQPTQIEQIVESTKQKPFAVAQFILSQLHACAVEGYDNGKTAMIAWGVEKMVGSETFITAGGFSNAPNPDTYGQGWLRLKCTAGKFFRGWVRVILNADSSYNVRFESADNKSGEMFSKMNLDRIAADRVASMIDVVLFGPVTDEAFGG